MAEMVEGGASLAWRLLATLEGGSLLLATSALLAYSARKRVAKLRRTRRPVRSVLLTNTSSLLGKELQTRLESHGCVVHTISEDLIRRATTESPDGLTSNATSGTSGTSGATGNTTSETSEASYTVTEPRLRVDALVVVGAHSPPKAGGLQGMAKLVSEDVYNNLKLLETLSSVVRRGGLMAWACAGAGTEDAWGGAADAFDTVLHANLHHVARLSSCEAVWVGRGEGARQAAEKLVDALLNGNDTQQTSRFSIRNAAHKAGEYIGRWLKIVT